MIKKINLVILLTILILVLSSLSTTAYFETSDYRKSLLKIRDTERNLNNLHQNLAKAEANFAVIDLQNISLKLEKINKLHQKQLQAYQNKNDKLVNDLAEKIIIDSEKLILKTIESKPVQLRGLWLDSGTLAKKNGRAGVSDFLDLVKKANFNVIFPETFYKGLSIIPDNQLFIQDHNFNSWEEDPLQVLIEEAHLRGIEVHPWVWVFNENTKGKAERILKQNPEWANKNRKGEIISYHNSSWLSPAREDVKKFLQQRYIYLVKNYNLDGINLDYIRFPEEYRGSFGYDQVSVEKFKKIYKLDPFQIKSGSANFKLWNQFREGLVTEMVKEISTELRKIDSKILISADVIPGRKEARYRALQNWSLWLKKDYLDFVLPMTYTENLFSELNNWIKKDRSQINKPLYAGISIFKLTPDQVIDQLQEVNKINPNGMSLFAAAHLKTRDYQTLSESIFSKSALIPQQNKEKSLKILQKFILSRLQIIKKTGAVDNSTVIRIRAYLNQSVKQDLSQGRLDFKHFLQKNNLKLLPEVEKVLAADFSYLEDLKRLY